MSTQPIYWSMIISLHGQLDALLKSLPRARWTKLDDGGSSLLHSACESDGNMAAAVALVRHGLDVNAHDHLDRTPALVAAHHGCAPLLEMLCAVGADMVTPNHWGLTPLDATFDGGLRGDRCARVLVANGVRLSTLREDHRYLITPELWAFERGVLRCRAAVVAFLRVKRASGQLVRWDKFLLAAIAVNVWTTRYANEWQK